MCIMFCKYNLNQKKPQISGMMVGDMNMNFIPANFTSVPAKLVEIMRAFNTD